VHNLIRALAQELALHGISINGIALGWMAWMHDRLDRTDEEASRAQRFPISKRAGVYLSTQRWMGAWWRGLHSGAGHRMGSQSGADLHELSGLGPAASLARPVCGELCP
jgi:NAD(P)-dependent dehydrogenase (short-subunit alcohol dehydrogenase family)